MLMKESQIIMKSAEVGTAIHPKNLAEEMKDLRELFTLVMVDKCRSKNEGVACPKPRRWQGRQSGEHGDLKIATELSDILLSKASPPYYSGSPPIRSSNPLIQDAHFQDQRFSKGPGHVRAEGLEGVNRNRSTRSVPTMA